MAKKNKLISQEAIKWCFKEGYKIYPVTKDNLTYQVEVRKAHQTALLTDTYTPRTIDQAISDTYMMLYNKWKGK